MSRFYEGQKVVCINEHFPMMATTEADKSRIGTMPPIHPVKGETLVIDEILGEMLRFDKYDTEASFNWWIGNHFKPLDEFEIMLNSEQTVQGSVATKDDSSNTA